MSLFLDIEIHDTLTGRTAVYEDKWDYGKELDPEWEGLGGWRFSYGEHNYCCDCNRGLFLERALGLDPHWDAFECGDSRFVIRRVTNRDTREVLLEGDPREG